MASMQSLSVFVFLSILVFSSWVDAKSQSTGGTANGLEQWGYVEVRPKAHLFWWYYESPYRVDNSSNPWPLVLWLQGGPGVSATGIGNFLEIGPMDVNLNPRSSTWLTKADLLFVDSPVGTGFSYVEDENLLITTEEEGATDLTTLLKVLFNKNKKLRMSPVFIFGEHYGGKFAVNLGLSALNAIEKGELNLQLRGVALVSSWISPEDFVLSWGPLLDAVSRIDNNALIQSNSIVQKIQQQIAQGNYADAEGTCKTLVDYLLLNSNNVDFYNFMSDSSQNPIVSQVPSLGSLMNGAVKQKLKIIPTNITWGQKGPVFSDLLGEYMKPRINEVDQLLANGVHVTIVNGQTDLLCSTLGVESWVNKLKSIDLGTYLNVSRTPLYCGNSDPTTKAFVRSHQGLSFYWILGSGHFVPADQPCISLQMAGNITQSPNANGLF